MSQMRESLATFLQGSKGKDKASISCAVPDNLYGAEGLMCLPAFQLAMLGEIAI